MNELIKILTLLSNDFRELKEYIHSLDKSRIDVFKEAWIDGQDVMQSLHISKRNLQSLRDNKILPFSRINGKFYYKISDLEKLLQSNYSHFKPKGHGK